MQRKDKMKRYIRNAGDRVIKNDDIEICNDIGIHLKKLIEDEEIFSSLPYGSVSHSLKKLFKDYYDASDFGTDSKMFNRILTSLCYNLHNNEDVDELIEDIDANCSNIFLND